MRKIWQLYYTSIIMIRLMRVKNTITLTLTLQAFINNANDLTSTNYNVLLLYFFFFFLNKHDICNIYMYIIRQYACSLPSSSRLSSRTSIPLIQNVPSSVRTAKAERRLKERLIQEVLYLPINTSIILINSTIYIITFFRMF